MVVASWVDGELAEELAGGGVDDADVEVLDEQEDVGSGVGSPDSDVAQSAGHAQGDGACLVDLVLADSVVGLDGRTGAGGGLGSGCVDGGRCRSVLEGAVRAAVVVLLEEGVEEGL